MKVFNELSDIKEVEIMPGLHAKILHSKNQTIVFWRIEEGADLPAHSHPHEQISIINSGDFKLRIGNKERVLSTGSIAIIPSNVEHEAKALTYCEITDVFNPCREDLKYSENEG